MSASSSAMRTRCGLPASVGDPVMSHILAVARPISDRGGILYGGKPRERRRKNDQALVSQLAEETDSKPVQCEFESHRGHSERVTGEPRRTRPLLRAYAP